MDFTFCWKARRAYISFAVLLVFMLLSVPIRAQDSSQLLLDGDDAFRAGKFDEAATKYRAALDAEPKNVRARYWLMRTLLEKGETPEALATIEQGLQWDPEDPILLQGLGEVRYGMGEIEEARTAFLAALGHDSNLPRARLGLAKVLFGEGRYKSAKFHLERAYELDPNDPEIILAWSQTFKGGQEEIALLRRYVELTKNETPEHMDYVRSYLEFLENREGRGTCKLASENLPTQITIVEDTSSGLPRRDEFRTLYPASRMTHPAPFIQVAFNGPKAKTLLLDTGASGILLSERAAQEAGIRPITKTYVGGIGSEGRRKAYFGVADRMRIGNMEFRDCTVTVTPGQYVPRDGLIGTDFFSRFLITLDLPGLALRLDSYPEAQAIADNPPLLWQHDRKLTGDRARFEPARKSGSHLLIKTRINKVQAGWFLLDTGAAINIVSLLTAKKVTKTSQNQDTVVHGVSGRVGTYEGQSITMEFATFRQANFSMITLDMKGQGKTRDLEIAGLLGYPTLRLFTIQIDYLNAAVNFSYAPR